MTTTPASPAPPDLPEQAPGDIPWTGWRRTFNSLKYREYRLLWTGQLFSTAGDWMDQIALNWLVFTLTGSAVWLAILNLTRLAPMLIFGLVAGITADRYDRRKVMLVTNVASMLLAVALAIVVTTGVVEVWMVLLIGAGRGIFNSFNLPSRQSLIADIVPRYSLTNALALNSMVLNTTRLVGPALGGVMIATVGIAAAFWLNAASFLAVIAMLLLMRIPLRTNFVKDSPLESMKEGLRFVAQHRAIASLLILALIPVTLALPYQAMLPVFAEQVLDIGAVGFGLLTSASGLGALMGGLGVATWGDARGRGRVMAIGIMVMGIALIGFAFSVTPWLSFILVMFIGVGQTSYMTSNNAMLQSLTPQPMRGRVASLSFLNRGLMPLGAVVAGVGVETIGPAAAIATMGVLVIVLTLGVLWRAPEIMRLR